MSEVNIKPEEWLEFMTQPYVPGLTLQAVSGPIMNPSNAAAVGDYAEIAAASATSGSAPGSIFEGMQTAANLARTRAGYNPIDPEGTGNKAHFLQFAQNIADAPFLALIKADTVHVNQKSQDSSKLIQSFVDAFVGIATENAAQIQTAVQNLANAAISYSKETQSFSNVAQNLLQLNSSGNVEFHLYSSKFLIQTSKRKGTITFQSSYEVLRAVYQLSPASWAHLKPLLQWQERTDTEDWLDQMTTPPNGSGGAIASCLQ